MVDKYRLRLYHHNVCTREWNGKSGEYCSNCNVAKYFREILLRNMNWYYSWIIWLRNTENDKSYIIRGVWGIEMQTAEVAQGQLLCRNSTQLLSGKLGKLLSQKTWKAPLMETHENLENSWWWKITETHWSVTWHRFPIISQLFIRPCWTFHLIVFIPRWIPSIWALCWRAYCHGQRSQNGNGKSNLLANIQFEYFSFKIMARKTCTSKMIWVGLSVPKWKVLPTALKWKVLIRLKHLGSALVAPRLPSRWPPNFSIEL